MMHKKILITASTLALAVPMVAHAYFTPSEILGNELFWAPPREGNEALGRVEQQQQASQLRREAEQDLLFSLQHPPEPALQQEPEEEVLRAAAPEQPAALELTERDLRLLETVRTLERREDRLVSRLYEQQIAQLTVGQPLHGGAPGGGQPLPPTGAGMWLAALTLLGAVGVVIWRARRLERNTKAYRV